MTRTLRRAGVAVVVALVGALLLPGWSASALPDRGAGRGPNASTSSPSASAVSGEEHGVSYDTYYLAADTPASTIAADIAWRATAGVNTIYVTVSEKDLADDRKLTAAIAAGHASGMRVVLDPYIGGTFSGDEGASAAGYLALHPDQVSVSRSGQVWPVPAIDNPAYRQYLRDTLSALLAYDVDGLILDEPQYPEASAAGDYFPYDPSAQAAFTTRFGHPMPPTETAETVLFRQESMKSFLGGLFDHARTIKPTIDNRLVVLPDHFDGNVRRGTENWADLASMTSLDALQTDPYWGPDEAFWPWFEANVDRLVAATAGRPGLRRGIWVNAMDLTSDYGFIGQTLQYARARGIEQLLAWETEHFPNQYPVAAWMQLIDSFSNPFGNLDAVSRAPGGVDVAGWAIDPDTTGPATVHVYVDGVGRAIIPAATARGDVGAAFPALGEAHGFSTRVAIGAGVHTVCAYAINQGPGWLNPTLGCSSINVSSDPFGYLDAVERVPGGVDVWGWAIDPDTSGPIDIHVYIDGVGAAITQTFETRADVAAAFPAWGPGRGFTVVVPTSAAPVTACVYAINVGGGTGNRLLGCLTG